MSNEQPSLSDILSDEVEKKIEPEAPAAPAEPAPPPDAAAEAAAKEVADEARREEYKSKRNKARDKEAIAQGKVRDPDTGQFVSPKAAKEDAPAPAKAEAKAAEPAKPAATAAPQQEFTDKEKAFLRAAQEERAKRQVLEQRLAALEASKPKEPEKTFWDDPEGALARQRDETRQEITRTRLQMAESFARRQHTDFDEKVAVFAQLVHQNPTLAQQWLAAPDPAEYAYALGKNHMELQAVGGMDEMRAKIERDTATRVRAEVEAEIKAKAEALAKDRAELPPSLSAARSTGGAAKPVWSGPPSFEEILK